MPDLHSEFDVRLSWQIDDPDENISMQLDDGNIQPEYTFTSGTGYAQHNEAWYNEFAVTGNTSYDIDFTNLPIKLFGMEIFKQFDILKSITIENTSPSSTIYVGSSGASNAFTGFGYATEVGVSGVLETTSLIGYEIDSTNSNIKITNHSADNINVRMLVIGVYGI